uniref:Polo kinase n=1 Tax=Strongyloides venezuelensis TaxID=75913 RepID=A0A0K0FV75_STRVS
MESNLLAEPPVEEQKNIGIVDKGIPILLKWKRVDEYICFILLNGVLQINFRQEHTKVDISIPTASISVIYKDNKLKSYSLRGLVDGGWDKFMEEKISHVKKIVEEWTSLKRKHENNVGFVPVKKINNNV